MFQHPANRIRTGAAYGCACGCAACSDRSYGNYGAESAKKWDPDPTYLSTCKDYEKQYKKWLKAYNKYQSLPAFLGIRTGPEVEKAMSAMRKAKAAGEAALAKCQGEEYTAAAEQLASAPTLSTEELMAISGGGVSQFSQGGASNILVPLIGIGVLGLGGLVVYRVVQNRKVAAKKAAAKKATPAAPASATRAVA